LGQHGLADAAHAFERGERHCDSVCIGHYELAKALLFVWPRNKVERQGWSGHIGGAVLRLEACATAAPGKIFQKEIELLSVRHGT